MSRLVIQITGTIVGVWAAVVTAIVEAFLVPLRIAGYRVPIVLLCAVVINIALIWFTWWVTENRFLAVLPALSWSLTILLMSAGTSEGDVILPGNDWVSLGLLLLGMAACAFGGYSVTLKSPRPRISATPPASSQDSTRTSDPSPTSASGTGQARDA